MPPNQVTDGLAVLTLGQVQFAEWEVPEDIDRFCGTHKLVVHEFPGGQRTVQKMGPFPPRSIRWEGVFWEGDQAGGSQDRVDQLNQMRVAGDVVELSFGAYTYDVVIHDFAVRPRSIFRQPYLIEVVPVRDNTASSQQQFAPPPTAATTQLAQQNSGLAELTSNFQQAANTPASQAAAAQQSSFQQQLGNTLQQSNGNINNVNTNTIQASLQQTQQLVGAQGNSTSSAIASNALNSNAMLGVIGNTLQNQQPILTKLTIINPDLKALAVIFYGDASLWTVIAKANKLAVPRPVGIFKDDTGLIIPQVTANAS
jgi:hypothetical protein